MQFWAGGGEAGPESSLGSVATVWDCSASRHRGFWLELMHLEQVRGGISTRSHETSAERCPGHTGCAGLTLEQCGTLGMWGCGHSTGQGVEDRQVRVEASLGCPGWPLPD